MNQTWIQEYDSIGNKVYREDGSASFVLKESRIYDPKSSTVITDKKTDKVFHSEAGKGSRRR